jgi:UDP-N-acetylglucosamine transferase subunit ALG13
MARADVVISHAGGGSVLAALRNGKRPIVVARRGSHGEFNDDHQEEIATRLEASGLAFRAHLDTLSWADVVEAAQWTIRREPNPTALPLRP